MAANPLTIEDLIARAVDAGEIVQGVNDPQNPEGFGEGRRIDC
jgi:hypothetical protein